MVRRKKKSSFGLGGLAIAGIVVGSLLATGGIAVGIAAAAGAFPKNTVIPTTTTMIPTTTTMIPTTTIEPCPEGFRRNGAYCDYTAVGQGDLLYYDGVLALQKCLKGNHAWCPAPEDDTSTAPEGLAFFKDPDTGLNSVVRCIVSPTTCEECNPLYGRIGLGELLELGTAGLSPEERVEQEQGFRTFTGQDDISNPQGFFCFPKNSLPTTTTTVMPTTTTTVMPTTTTMMPPTTCEELESIQERIGCVDYGPFPECELDYLPEGSSCVNPLVGLGVCEEGYCREIDSGRPGDELGEEIDLPDPPPGGGGVPDAKTEGG